LRGLDPEQRGEFSGLTRKREEKEFTKIMMRFLAFPEDKVKA
jgi:hypothetical protein